MGLQEGDAGRARRTSMNFFLCLQRLSGSSDGQHSNPHSKNAGARSRP